MPSLVFKKQKCSKKNCKCFKLGLLHGGYFWLVSYVGTIVKDNKKIKKYDWKYLGKTADEAAAKLEEHDDFIKAKCKGDKFKYQGQRLKMKEKLLLHKKQELEAEEILRKAAAEEKAKDKKPESQSAGINASEVTEQLEDIHKLIDEEVEETKPKPKTVISKQFSKDIGALVKEIRRRQEAAGNT